ncbi:MAG: DUF1549 domain-containing protein, partial [Saprospiraceae bacterium]|nr:DUF1549 domain-containing protein [Saprospiraceae bacterium]
MTYQRIIGFCLAAGLYVILDFGCGPSRDTISYSEQIKPLLNKKCLRCHGGIRQQGGFSLLFEEEAFAPTESGNIAIVKGNPRASELIRRIKESDPEQRMPQEGDPLTADEIELLEKWIDQGAEWDEHWSYRPLTSSELPEGPPEWLKNPIDHFVYARLREHSLDTAEKAAPHILVRRLGIDLIGLPTPRTWAEQYLSDPTDERYEILVDSLLASDHFGERWAAMWLDLARYADSKGYEKDLFRSIWKYRDWVIHAFNDDMPFDQFTVEQLAGDLLPSASTEQHIATAFHRNTMTNTEGGTEDEEYRSASIIDRVNTTFEVWQGTTISCVQCHSHPYDPFRHKEYFQLFDYFNHTQDADLDSEFPFTLEHADSTLFEMQFLANRIRKQGGAGSDKIASRDAIRDLVFPRLFADLADDFNDVLIQPSGWFSTGSYNVNNLKDKRFYLLFKDVNLENMEQIGIKYRSKGDDALLEVRLDDLDGPVICAEPLLNTNESKKSIYRYFSSKARTGAHDLIFQFVNTTGKLPDGMVSVEELELVYNGEKVPYSVRVIQDSLLQLYRTGTQTPVMRERSRELDRTTHVFDRGNYELKGEQVYPALPKVLVTADTSAATSRLDLASWIVSESNALTPRVIANRFWEQIFGFGIVRTLEDFGTQGIPPTHPALLDYLALEFSTNWKWSVKRLLKEMVMSSTYMQSAASSEEKLEKDPNNYWLSRGPRIRLSAEQIRDQALSVSGLLNNTIGGPSVMPPQPDGIWQVVYN